MVTDDLEKKSRMERKEREGLKVSRPISLSTGFNSDKKSNGAHDES